jgi:hypothetical protein
MFRALLIATAATVVLPAAGYWTPVHAQPAAGAMAANPWSKVTRQTLPAAIRAAETFSGGQVLEIRFRGRHGVQGFDAVVAKSGSFSRVQVDLPSNRVGVIAETEIPAWMANYTLKADVRSLQKTKLRLADAVRTAEQITNSPAVDAAIARPLSGGGPVVAYDVEVIRDNRPERVVIDANTGRRIADPQPLLQNWTPEQALSESLKEARPHR